jgi:hypothetical protein
LDGAAGTADTMTHLAARADAYAAEVIQAKGAIRSLIEMNLPRYADLLAAQRRLAEDVLTPFVANLAQDVNQILDTAAAHIGPGAQIPDPLPVPPPDAGAGPHGSVPPTQSNYDARTALGVAAVGASLLYPHAAEHLAHYLSNTGTTEFVNADEVTGDVPRLAGDVERQLQSALLKAAADARANGTYGVPTSFATPWSEEFNIRPEDNRDWHYGIGNVHHSVTGVVTVHPPDQPGGNPRVDVDYQVHLYDRYNWDNDPGKQAIVAGFIPAPDAALAPLHRAGIAQEFDIKGVSEVRTVTREVPG